VTRGSRDRADVSRGGSRPSTARSLSDGARSPAAAALALQRTAGNRATTAVLRGAPRPSPPTLQRSVASVLTDFGTGVLEADAEAAPEEAASGPVGWAIGIGGLLVGATALGLGSLMSRPTSNVDQNKQFADAVKEIERRIGRRLSKDEIRRLHEALHDEDDPGFWDIVNLGLDLFGPPSGAGAGAEASWPDPDDGE
jgi:hypothetical protein